MFLPLLAAPVAVFITVPAQAQQGQPPQPPASANPPASPRPAPPAASAQPAPVAPTLPTAPAQQAPTQPTQQPVTQPTQPAFPLPPDPDQPPGTPKKAPPPQPPPSQAPPVVERDPLTGEIIPQRDENGQIIVPKDETGQPLLQTDETGQILPPPPGTEAPVKPDSLLRAMGPTGAFDPAMEGGERPLGPGTYYHLQLALIEGFNTNVAETQPYAGGPVTHHPSLYTGASAGLLLTSFTSATDQQTLSIMVRGQHYTPADGYNQTDDGTVAAFYARTYALDARTIFRGSLGSTLTSSNSALLSDGSLYQIDPTNRVYTIETAAAGVTRELTKRTRLSIGVDTLMSTTVSEAPVVSASGQIVHHRGIDSIATAGDGTVLHDLDPYNTAGLHERYVFMYIPFTTDYTHNPPEFVGASTNNSLLSEATWGHAYNEHLRSELRAGVVVSQPGALDPDQRTIISPAGHALLGYSRNYWLVQADGGYTYGTTNPRIGVGPGVTAGFMAQGIPYPHGRWMNFAVLANGALDRSAQAQSNGTFTRLNHAGATVEIRYAINNWLGLLGGYAFHYTQLEGQPGGTEFPELVRHIFFFGVSGYFSNDRTLPTLQTFQSPYAPL